MSELRKFIDLQESFEGDLIVANGDIADTLDDYSGAIYQVIRTVLNTKPGECGLWPTMGFNTDLYEGNVNTRETGLEIAKAIRTAIVNNTVLYSSEVDVESFPLGKQSIAFKVNVTTTNGVTSDFILSYDTQHNKIRSLVFNDASTNAVPVTIKKNISPTKNSRIR